LENDLVRYEFDNLGRLKSCKDKEDDKEYLIDYGNIISLYEDIPNNWDAWDIDFFYRQALIETAKIDGKILRTDGEFYQDISFNFKIGNSTVKQTVSLNSSSKRLDFDTSVHWKEKYKMLRVHFPINIRSDQASFDIQYGYVKRNTHRNTSWDKAKFEVVGHHYADLSDLDNGVALMNDCKYGYMVHDNILDLNLLRSPNNPDPDADMGDHSFTYSFYPHKNDLVNSNVISESACLNKPPLTFKGVKSKNKVPLFLEGEGLELTVLKKAEKSNHLVIRIVEKMGRKAEGFIHLNGKLTECDLIEWERLKGQNNVKEKLKLAFKPFEIKTFLFDNS
jgi:alpha-mannosidase